MSQASYNGSEKRLHVITDGGENFSSKASRAAYEEKFAELKSKTNQLQIITVVFNAGGPGNVVETRQVADMLGARFKGIVCMSRHLLTPF